MSETGKKGSRRRAAKRLAELAAPKPKDIADPDALDAADGTTSRLRRRSDSSSGDESDGEVIAVGRSRLRTAQGLKPDLETGVYAGKVVSRKDLGMGGSGSGSGSGSDSEEGSEGDDVDGSESDGNRPYGNGSSRGKSDSESETDSDDDASSIDDDAIGRELAALQGEDMQASLRLRKAEATDVEKGVHTKHQTALWESFLEMRIMLQRGVVLGSRLPQPEAHRLFKRSPTTRKAYDETTSVLRSTLNDLLELNAQLAGRIPDVAKALGARGGAADLEGGATTPMPVRQLRGPRKGGVKRGRSEEDTPSDDQEEGTPPSTDEYWLAIQGGWASCGAYRESTLNKWGRKLQLAGGAKKMRVLNQDVTTQVEAILKHTRTSARRTRALKASVKALGSPESAAAAGVPGGTSAADGKAPNTAVPGNDDYDLEVYDDGEFYHQLLNAFIDSAGGAASAPSKKAKKTKKAVVRGASKGRKLRYNVHPKLVNFMEPSPWPDAGIDVDNLVKSLFR